MNNTKKVIYIILVLMLVLFIGGCTTAVDDDNNDDNNDEDIVILEPGDLPDNSDEVDPALADIVFSDKGEYTTIDDLMLSQAKISSYYYQQSIPYTDGSVFVRVWYADNKIKVISSVEGYVLSEFYYDLEEMTVITYSPSSGDIAIKGHFSEDSENAPGVPLTFDYASYQHIGNEDVARQLCYILEADSGDKLWVSTKYGFPLQKEFVGHFGERYVVAYKNIMINSISADEVAVPDDLEIYDPNSGTEE